MLKASNPSSQRILYGRFGTPDEIAGKGAVSKNFEELPLMFKSLKYSKIKIMDTTNNDFAVVFSCAAEVLNNGDPYSQNYVPYVRLNDEEADPRAQRVYESTAVGKSAGFTAAIRR
jgi:ketosteroid isomerase-like protein